MWPAQLPWKPFTCTRGPPASGDVGKEAGLPGDPARDSSRVQHVLVRAGRKRDGDTRFNSTFKLRCLPRLLLQGLPTAPQSSGGFRAASLAAAPVREASHPQLRSSQRAVRGQRPTDMGSPRPESRPQFGMTLRPLQRQSSLQLPVTSRATG